MTHQVKKGLGVTLRHTGAEFRVWAPFAKAVSLTGTFTDTDINLASEQDGYWSTIVDTAEPGSTYRYQITGQDDTIFVKNDPRARAITSSDNGFSVVVGNEFDWSGDTFTLPAKNQQVIYELHVGTFNRVDAATPGTFDTAIEKLDYLQGLGINMIELMPVTSMAFSNGWGYAPNYIFSVESMLGGRHGLMKFTKACHDRGIGVILDVVYNHFYGDTDLWQYDGWSENGRGGIYFYNDERGDTPWGGRPDYGRPEVRQFILDNIVMWFAEYHVDGLRIDSTIYMRNTEGLNDDPSHDIGDAWQLLSDATNVAHKLKPDAVMIAEDCASNSYINKPTDQSGCGFDAQWGLGFPHALRDVLGLNPEKNPSLSTIRHQLEHSFTGDPFDTIIFSDSHDTAANGSVRLTDAAARDHTGSLESRQKSLLADAVMLTAPGIPMMLQGAEFLQDGAFNDWKELDWQNADHYAGIVEAHKHLIALRHNLYDNTKGLTGGSVSVFHEDESNLVLGYHRWDKGGARDDTLVVINFSGNTFNDYSFHLPLTGKWRVRFNSSWKGYGKDFPEKDFDTVVAADDNTATIELAPYCIYVLSQDS